MHEPANSSEPSAAWLAYRRTMTRDPDIHQAARANDIPLLKRLLLDSPDVNAKDAKGYAPLMLAAYGGHAEAVEVLLAQGADPNTCDAAGNSVLMGAACKGYSAIGARLARAGAALDTRNHAGLDAVQFARMFGRGDTVELLARLGRCLARTWLARPIK